MLNAKNSPAIRTIGKSKKLEQRNENLSKFGVYLHPTKGYRRLNAKRNVAEHLAGLMRTGARPIPLEFIRHQLANVG